MVKVRAMQVSDAEQVASIHIAAWKQAYQDILPAQYLLSLDQSKMREKWRNGMQVNEDLIRLVALKDKKIVGFAVGQENRYSAAAPAELYAIYVDPRYWHDQIGTTLLNEFKLKLLERNWDSFVVWSLEANNIGRRFYEKHSGRLLETRKNFKIADHEYPEVCYLLDC